VVSIWVAFWLVFDGVCSLCHLLPEPLEVSREGSLPWGCSTPDAGAVHQGLLPVAERLAQLHPVGLFALGGIGAELERTTVLAVGPRLREPGHTDRPGGVEWRPVPSQARWQAVAIGPPEASFALGRVAALGQVQQEEHVGDQLLGTRMERGPSGGWRDLQVVLAP
jgi:hypothetical protein